MEKRKKNTSILFFILLLLIAIVFIAFPKYEYSKTERRALAEKPKLSWSTIYDSSYLQDIEVYLQDHFPMRDKLRYDKFRYDTNILRKKESGEYYKKDGHIAKLLYKVDPEEYMKSADYFNKYIDKLFSKNKIYYSIIPDKNYYLINGDYPKLDWEEMLEMFQKNLYESARYIDITKDLSIDDYYRTDLHWRQENLIDLSRKILFYMDKNFKVDRDFNMKKEGEFIGAYGAAIGEDRLKDNLYTLTTESHDTWSLKDLTNSKKLDIYDQDAINSLDGYSVFLSGPQSLIELKSSSYKESDKTLYIIRDSFASSLAPLLTSNYKRIVLIDPRYLSINFIEEFIEVSAQDDLLILSSVTILSNSSLFK